MRSWGELALGREPGREGLGWTAGNGWASGEDGGVKGFGSGGADLGASIGGRGCDGECLDEVGCGLAGAMSISHPSLLGTCGKVSHGHTATSFSSPPVFLERPSSEHSCSDPRPLHNPDSSGTPSDHPSQTTPLTDKNTRHHSSLADATRRQHAGGQCRKAPRAVSRGR